MALCMFQSLQVFTLSCSYFQLSSIERYAMTFVEETDSWSAKQLAEAEAEIERQKKDWEMNRLAAVREEEERRQRLADDEPILTYSREDANIQVNSGKKLGVRSKRLPAGKRIQLSARSSRCNSRSNSIDDSVEEDDKKEKVEDRKEILRRKKRIDRDDDGESIHSNDSHDISMNNHNADPTSPRTRSRGSVSINLWTLDRSTSPTSVEGPGSPNFQSTVKKRKRGRPRKEDRIQTPNRVTTKETSFSQLSPFANPKLLKRTRRTSSTLRHVDGSDAESNDSPDGRRVKKLKMVKRKRRSEGSMDSNGLS